MSSVKGCRLADRPWRACWWRQVSCLLGSVTKMLRVRLLATPRARTGKAQTKSLCTARLQITFPTLQASSINTVLLHGRAFSAAVSAVTSVSLICLCWRWKSRLAWLLPAGLSPYLCAEDACSGRWGMRLNSPIAGACPVQTESTEVH